MKNTVGPDKVSVYARNVRAHFRVSLNGFLKNKFSYHTLLKVLTYEQKQEWLAATKRADKVREEQQNPERHAREYGLNHLPELVDRGRKLMEARRTLARERAKIASWVRTDDSQKRVFIRRLRTSFRRIELERQSLILEIGELDEGDWDFVVLPSPKHAWLLSWKEWQDFAPLPYELVHAEQIALLRKWVAEWEEKISTYETATAA